MNRLNAAAIFRTQLEKTKDEMLDIIDTKGEYSERFDIQIIVDDKLFRTSMDADVYSHIECLMLSMIKQEVAEILPATREKLEWFAEYLQYMEDCGDARHPEFAFSFDGVCIINPFVDDIGRRTVEPYSYYGEPFVKSAWTDSAKIDAIIEPVRKTATRFLQCTDPNGDYLDGSIEGSHMSFIDTLKYFCWYANSDYLDSKENFEDGTNDAETAFERVRLSGLLGDTLHLMFELPRANRTTYRSIWDHGVTGFSDGLFII